MLGADLCTAFCDVAVADPEHVFEFFCPILGIERVHFKRSGVNQKSRPDEFFVFHMVAEYVANILTKKSLDALAKILYAIDVRLLHPPRAVLSVRRPRAEFFDAFLDLEIP